MAVIAALAHMEHTLIWSVVVAITLGIVVPYYVRFRRVHRHATQQKKEAHELGIDRARAQYPHINVSLCIGCGSCARACPEEDVLAVVLGTATVVNGVRCVGHGHCATACPVGAITIGLGDIRSRDDIPVMNEYYETTVPGLYIAGELGGQSLIRNAIDQGHRAVERIAQTSAGGQRGDMLDVIIVGAGPAGFSAALTAIQHKLSYVVLEERDVGGTILHYPRRKLVMTQPVEIPLYGWLRREEYSKEDLVAIWQEITGNFNPEIRTGEKVEHIRQEPDGLVVQTQNGAHKARNVVLAMGRRGTPRKLDVPGEDLSKVMYQLVDAQSYSGLHLLVVGGGDSAVEAAVGLARQPGNTVTVSYRKNAFFRVKKKNEVLVNRFIEQGIIHPIFDSQVVEIREKSVVLRSPAGQTELPNDYVFVFIGGSPPFPVLREAGIAFGSDMPAHEKRPKPPAAGHGKLGLIKTPAPIVSAQPPDLQTVA